MPLTPEQSSLFKTLISFPNKKSKEYTELKEMFRKGLSPENSVFLTAIEEAEQESNVRNIVISKQDRVSAVIRNGEEGLVKRIVVYDKEKNGKIQENTWEYEILRFNGSIGPVVKIDNEMPGLVWIINGERTVGTIDECILYFRQKFALSGDKLRYFIEVINSYVMNEIKEGKWENYASSPVSVVGNVVKIDFQKEIDLKSVLTLLREFYGSASHPNAYLAVFAWSLLAPLHYDLKRRSKKGIKAPFIVESGKTHGGKTTLAVLFIGKGYSLSQDDYFYSYDRVRTKFTFTKHMSQTNLPALIDDIPLDWIPKYKEDLKSYVQTGHFGDLGTPSQGMNEYMGRRSFIVTINDDITEDEDLALSLRFILLKYTESETARKDKKKFDQLFDSLPEGFMYAIFKRIFEGIDIMALLGEVEALETPREWIQWMLGKVNELCKQLGVENFPSFEEVRNGHGMDNALEVAQEFIAEWQRIEDSKESRYDSGTQEAVVKQKYRSKIENSFRVEFRERIYIYFTSGAFKALCGMQNLRLPYTRASNFINNIKSSDGGVRVENNGDTKSVKINGIPLKCYCISIPNPPD